MQILGPHFWINFVLAMTMQWFITLWVGVIRPQNWKLPLKWMGWALIPAVIGQSWALLLPPISALLYLIHHQPRLTLIFVNATIVVFLVVVMVNDVVRAVAIEIFGWRVSQSMPVITLSLVFQIIVYTLFSVAVSGMRLQPGNLEILALSRKEQWTVMALLVSLATLARLSSVMIHHLVVSHAMLTFDLSIELVMILSISASLFVFLQSFFHRQRVQTQYQEALLRTRYDQRVSDQAKAIRLFKQRYQQQMLKLGDYLDAEDYVGLATYYQTLNSQWQTTSQLAGLEAAGLQRLHDPSLKSLLFQKLLTAQGQGLILRLEIPDLIQYVPMNSVQLLRVMGILLDNAIEAGGVGQRREIHCAILDYPDAVELAVANPVSMKNPPQLAHIMAAGYTTKGTGHGQGLRIVQEIIGQTPGAALQLALKHDQLYFTIILLKSGGELRDNG